MIPGVNIDSWPVWLVFLSWVFFKVYGDILKPYLEKRLASKLKSEETKKYNDEAEFKNKMLSYVEKSVIDVISANQAQIILTMLFQNAAKELIFRLFDRLDKNEIKNPTRQRVIKQDLNSFLKDQKNRAARAVHAFSCGTIKLSQYVELIQENHTQSFISEVETILFSELDIMRKKDDLQLLVTSHYNNHVNEAVEMLTLKN